MVVSVSGGSGRPGEPQAARLLTNSALEEMRAIPGVASVIPRDLSARLSRTGISLPSTSSAKVASVTSSIGKV